MRAIDTNLIVRFLTGYDAMQAKKARKVIQEGNVFISTSVLLESEWVLRSGYSFFSHEVIDGLRGLAGLPGVELENPKLVASALEWAERGMDLQTHSTPEVRKHVPFSSPSTRS